MLVITRGCSAAAHCLQHGTTTANVSKLCACNQIAHVATKRCLTGADRTKRRNSRMSRNNSDVDKSHTSAYETVPREIRDHLFLGRPVERNAKNLNGSPWNLHPWPRFRFDSEKSDPGAGRQDILAHLTAYAREMRRPYYELMVDAALAWEAPPLPRHFRRTRGWTRYNQDGSACAVDFPSGSLLFFDVETCPSVSQKAVLAVALCRDAWYSWCSRELSSDEESSHSRQMRQTKFSSEDLIPIGPSKSARLLVGHNVAFDRARLREPYQLELDCLRFWDTMSMHIAVCGMTVDQIADYKKFDKRRKPTKSGRWMEEWFERTSPNNLQDVHKFHCPSTADEPLVDKSERDLFVKGSVGDIKENFQAAAAYCARDVLATMEVFQSLWPKFDTKFANPITQWGMLELSTSYFPITDIWWRYKNECTSTAGELKGKLHEIVSKTAGEAVRLHGGDILASTSYSAGAENWTRDAWLWPLNWRPRKWPADLIEQVDWVRQLKVKVNEKFAPWWLVSLFKRDPESRRFKAVLDQCQRMKDSRIPSGGKSITLATCEECVPPGRQFRLVFHPLPHPLARTYGVWSSHAVGSPLTQHWLEHLDSGAMGSQPANLARDFAHAARHLKYWTQIEERLGEQMVYWVWECPQAPSGYKFVGADVDSQEQWLAGLFGDWYKAGGRPLLQEDVAVQRRQGLTGFSQMLLSGSRAKGTDLHSRVGEILSVSRHDAKVFNYARLYGAGERYSVGLMRKSIAENDKLTPEQKVTGLKNAESDIRRMFAQTKGKKKMFAVLSGAGAQLFRRFYAQYGRFGHMCERRDDGTVWVMVAASHWKNAPSESETFNCLEDLGIWVAEPRTPVLQAGLSQALTLPPGTDGYRDFVGARGRSRINWVVQSSGVDFLHIFVTAMHWLRTEYKMDARFAISIHDEIRYLVSERDSYRFALAMHLANLYTRAAVCAALDMTDSLPMSIASFSKVQVDSVLRKDPRNDAITPSNPNGLWKQYGVPPGISLDLDAAFHTTMGKLDGCQLGDESKMSSGQCAKDFGGDDYSEIHMKSADDSQLGATRGEISCSDGFPLEDEMSV